MLEAAGQQLLTRLFFFLIVYFHMRLPLLQIALQTKNPNLPSFSSHTFIVPL
ncbi:hypothetical protein CU024_1826 [Enterococcus faecium]|uniref:hypothetical protein n=1 Tax=Enterococcus faecium TaxID=1352 RepID=UPI0001CEBDC1|nr:hypothetical protein [Enterococcus faecium]EFF31254.1 hypothetical protein EfmE1039_2182 [Enterococcus faecium E1039]EJX55551.1 hypothetical protein HMPREF1377_02151 [Enterococcus faecium R494]EJY49240.1 hypothetical protein HMPREF1347_01877 [Enterococcus faecium 504]EPI06616.1 hypothetical protein D357_02822 [Enterococcus faecium SD3B-2]MBK4758331.1 hypothetical protein [Enterococcus faecium]